MLRSLHVGFSYTSTWVSTGTFENYVRCKKFVLIRMSHALKNIWHSWILSINYQEISARGFLSTTVTTKRDPHVFKAYPWVMLSRGRPAVLRWNIHPRRTWVWYFIYSVSGDSIGCKKWLYGFNPHTKISDPVIKYGHFWQHIIVDLNFLI